MPEVPAELSLTAPQARVLGCLVEKQATTPDSYPMTLKALTTACNQSSSRFPVVQYEPTLVEATLHALKGKALIRIVHPAHGERATKYRHVLDEALDLTAAQLAVTALLFLRGPQTVAELKTRSERIFNFGSASEVETVLNQLATLDPSVVAVVERQPGQKEQRWIQMLEVDPEARAASIPTADNAARLSAGAATVVQELQQRVTELETRVERLVDALGDLVDLDERNHSDDTVS
ncbi:MAG: YceH family protein [Microthrixaceae bacterium]